jgi:enoyl-CoA hydratase
MSEQTVIVRQDGPVAWLYMNRPEKRNAINIQMAQEMAEALERLAADDEVRVLVVTGSGDRAFCAGADMAEAVSADATARREGVDAYGRLWRFPKPTIAAVNGFAFGGGCVIAICCDIRIASDTASFRLPGANYGLVVGASRMPALVGLAKAKELIFTARVVDAAEALAIGLVNKVVPAADLEREVNAMALMMAENSPIAIRLSKEVMNAASGIEEAARLEAEANRTLRGSDEHRTRFRAAAERVTGQR